MVLFWITLVLALIGTHADGEFCVLHSPSSLSFIRTSETMESLLKDIFCAALGLSIEQDAEWKGMYVMDPFNTPEAVVQVYIDGVTSLGENAGLNSKVFPLSVNEYEPDIFKGVKFRVEQRLDIIGDNNIVNIKLSDENVLDTIKNVFGNVNVMSFKADSALKLMHLKQKVEEDRQFLSELATLRAVIGKVQTGALIPDNLIDFYNFRFRSLHALADFHGPVSLQIKEAKKLLGDALQELSKAFVKAYESSVLVTVVTTNVAHTRRSARSITTPPGHSKKWPYEWLEPPLSRQKLSFKPAGARIAEDPTTNTTTNTNTKRQGTQEEPNPQDSKEDINTDDSDTKDIKRTINTIQIDYSASPAPSADDAAVFNILLWLGVVLMFSMLAIIYFCMDMDPGRDTIIYRMTTMRTKKDL